LGLKEYYSGDEIENNKMNGACDMCGGQERCIQGLVEKPEGKRPLEDLGRDARIILRRIFTKWVGGGGGHGLDQYGSGYGQMTGCCKRCNEPSDSIK